MENEEKSISQAASSAGLRFEPIFAKYAADNGKKAKEQKDQAREIATVVAQFKR